MHRLRPPQEPRRFHYHLHLQQHWLQLARRHQTLRQSCPRCLQPCQPQFQHFHLPGPQHFHLPGPQRFRRPEPPVLLRRQTPWPRRFHHQHWRPHLRHRPGYCHPQPQALPKLLPGSYPEAQPTGYSSARAGAAGSEPVPAYPAGDWTALRFHDESHPALPWQRHYRRLHRQPVRHHHRLNRLRHRYGERFLPRLPAVSVRRCRHFQQSVPGPFQPGRYGLHQQGVETGIPRSVGQQHDWPRPWYGAESDQGSAHEVPGRASAC